MTEFTAGDSQSYWLFVLLLVFYRIICRYNRVCKRVEFYDTGHGIVPAAPLTTCANTLVVTQYVYRRNMAERIRTSGKTSVWIEFKCTF